MKFDYGKLVRFTVERSAVKKCIFALWNFTRLLLPYSEMLHDFFLMYIFTCLLELLRCLLGRVLMYALDI